MGLASLKTYSRKSRCSYGKYSSGKYFSRNVDNAKVPKLPKASHKRIQQLASPRPKDALPSTPATNAATRISRSA
eukprot:CAMPEP_0176029510 /NCGR_PEP_ID=MMETSP0120_2-20121206/14502_1 /TAXON_ID=160619 /ORGANISM="Kryptoperidinium foliaceum, Strain CCMP 1326" /LENGTH=74 /DNA_ID=CAMNT_0017362737 /DNA_START=525 /DNA_END=745 /DNA_ORIENTATION=-